MLGSRQKKQGSASLVLNAARLLGKPTHVKRPNSCNTVLVNPAHPGSSTCCNSFHSQHTPQSDRQQQPLQTGCLTAVLACRHHHRWHCRHQPPAAAPAQPPPPRQSWVGRPAWWGGCRAVPWVSGPGPARPQVQPSQQWWQAASHNRQESREHKTREWAAASGGGSCSRDKQD